MMIPCQVRLPDPSSKYVGEWVPERGWIVSFEGSTAVVVIVGSGILHRFPFDQIHVDVEALHEQGLTHPWPPPKPPGAASKRPGRPPKRSEP